MAIRQRISNRQKSLRERLEEIAAMPYPQSAVARRSLSNDCITARNKRVPHGEWVWMDKIPYVTWMNAP